MAAVNCANRPPVGRLGLLLGQAGNRRDHAIAELAQTAAAFNPDLVVIKEIAGMLRGRALGEVPRMLESELLAAGFARERIGRISDEVDAARHLLQWAAAGDLIVLPIHQSAARVRLENLLDELDACGWRAGMELPISG
jgi:UDP-N-acetylmuramyl tripeptide synthase